MKWIPTTERLPEDGANVLVAFAGDDFWNIPMMADYLPKHLDWSDWRIVDLWGEYNEPYNFVTKTPTHWQPLPPPPENQ